jgi:hypothetical protein
MKAKTRRRVPARWSRHAWALDYVGYEADAGVRDMGQAGCTAYPCDGWEEGLVRVADEDTLCVMVARLCSGVVP